MGSYTETPELRWFDPLGKCQCGKPSTGILRGTGNDSYGPHCARCATKRLDESARVRAEIEKSWKQLRRNPEETNS